MLIGTSINKEQNSLEVRFKSKDPAIHEEATHDARVKILRDSKGDFNGVKVLDVFDAHEAIGMDAEDRFHKFIELLGYPSLYIGQGYSGKEFSKQIRDFGAKRPDYLVNVPDVGSFFVDVKCPKILSIPGNARKYLPLFYEDIQKLFTLQQSLLIPVWIAFADRYDDRFFMAPERC